MIMIRDPKTFCFNFDWSKDVDENLKHEIELIIKHNESLAENIIKKQIEQLLLNISMETIFMITKNSKTNEPQNLFLTCHKD